MNERMTMEELIDEVAALPGVLVLRPKEGDGTPEIAWGDTFFSYAPDGKAPANTQPFATIVTKDYPGDDRSRLDRPGAFRVNVHAGREAFHSWTGHDPRDAATAVPADPGEPDTVFAHPVYGTAGWLAVVNPGERTAEVVRALVRDAYERARARTERRRGR